ncbi:hypothetical protein LTR65_000904 [Meristemomyces frigidus]
MSVAAELSEMRTQIIANANALYDLLAGQTPDRPPIISIVLSNFPIATPDTQGQPRLQYIAAVLGNDMTLMQGAPGSSMTAAMGALLDVTMEVMHNERDSFFFRDHIREADFMARSGGLVANSGQPGIVTGVAGNGGTREASHAPSNGADAGGPSGSTRGRTLGYAQGGDAMEEGDMEESDESDESH